MKRLRFVFPLILLGSVWCAGQSAAQFTLPGLPSFRLPALPVPPTALPDLPFTPGSAVSTNLRNALPPADWLGALENGARARPGTSFTLAPGMYRFTVQSYCLHAGTYGPSQGAGYRLAPLSGDRADTIRGILQRSVRFPNIAQTDIQSLIWSIESGTRFTDLPLDLQTRVLPLMTPADVALSHVSLATLSPLLPPAVQQALNYYGQLRAQLTRAGNDYAALERLAVLSGVAPVGPGSTPVQPGAWSAAGAGFYARVFPSGYSKTMLEVLRVAPYTLTRDRLGRIVHFQSGGYAADATYADGPGQDRLEEGGMSVPVWRFATLRLTGPEPGQTLTLSGRGFVVPSTAVGFGQPFRSGQPRPTADRLQFAALVQRTNPLVDTSLGAWRSRAEAAQSLYDRIQEYRELYGRATARPSEQAIHDFTDLGHYRDGIKAAVQDEGLGWLVDHELRQRAALEYATCVLAEDCAAPGEQPLPETASFDPTGLVATPGNTLMQRLGISARELNP